MPTKGILYVSSRLSHPTSLTPSAFCKWYEETHIDQVVSLPGVPAASRWEALSPQPSSTTWSSQAPWLTIYEMPDIEYRFSEEFRGLDGQSEPEEELLERVFRQARFDTRFYEEVQVYEPPSVATSTPVDEEKDGNRFLIAAALEPPPDTKSEQGFDAWYREEHLHMLSLCKGYRRTRRYEVVNATTLDRYVRTEARVPRFLALHEFCTAEGLDWEGLRGMAETEWSRRVMGGLVWEEIGWYGWKRGYEGEEKE